MKTSPQDLDRIQRALEGLLSPEEQDAFKREVIRDADLRAAYVEQVWLHSALRAQSESLVNLLEVTEEAAPSPAPVAAPAPAAKKLQRWPVALWSAAAAASLTFAGSLLFSNPEAAPKNAPLSVATLIQADNCRWAGSELPTVVDAKLGTGKLALVEGIATLRFESGATVTMEAPTTLEILTAMHCRLIEGTLTAEVPEPAHGFTIDTPDIKVVDLGTKFGVTAGSAGNSQVRVFEGEVEIAGLKDGKPKRLTTGKGMHVGSGNTSADQEPSRGEQVKEAGGWTAIPTSFGSGKDGYSRRGDKDAPHGTHPLIMVKHTDLKAGVKNERRGIITFDISKIPTDHIHEAQLVLDPEPSGFGFSALVPDESRFAVYGLTDESLDAWDEKKMNWETMPGCVDSGVNADTTRKLAEFWMPRGGSGSPLTVRGDDLAEFIRQDTNGLVSFIIVRETSETDPSGMVHAFAAKEHPTARAPTLRLK